MLPLFKTVYFISTLLCCSLVVGGVLVGNFVLVGIGGFGILSDALVQNKVKKLLKRF